MNRDRLGRKIILAFVLTLIGYGVVFHFIQQRRTGKGPWLITFISESGTPAVVVNQPTLGIRDVRIVFANKILGTNSEQTMEFSQPRAVPFDVPFGKCVFFDPLFLPGTIALEMFGHEVQLMPRVLTIDKAERGWRSGETITLTNAAAAHL